MKTSEPSNHDEDLHKVLKEWRTDAALPPRFQEAVWQRIERAQVTVAPEVWYVVARWIGTMLPRPALAAFYVAVLLAVGATAGWAQARQDPARVKGDLGEPVLDPYRTRNECRTMKFLLGPHSKAGNTHFSTAR